MMRVDVELRLSPSDSAEPDAWYLPGCSPEDWLHEIAQWQLDHMGLRIYPLPRSISDRSAVGALVTWSGSTVPQASGNCIAFRQVGGQQFIPADASIRPELTPEELVALLPQTGLSVWHPSIGIVAFDLDDGLLPSDLLIIARPSPQRWDLASEGTRLAPSLTRISPESPPQNIEDVLSGSQDDIGTDSDQLFTPQTEQEAEAESRPENSGTGASKVFLRSVASMIRGLGKLLPPRGIGSENSGIRGFLARADSWVTEKLNRISAAMESRRQKELNRLLDMLEQDPDRGLRYAIPSHESDSRRRSQPSDRLAEHDTDFSLGSSGGGSDPWSISPEMWQRLLNRYRELANRELNLGRFRRAAYIYAELLGDYYAAANALEQGRHFREAAVLYRTKLGSLQHATECLRRGGLWAEAVELYLEQGQFEKAGDILAEMKQHEESEEMYQKAVAQHLQQSQSLDAARILECKLNAPDEAIATLNEAWHLRGHSDPCLKEVFAIASRHGRHEAARRLIEEVREPSNPASKNASVIDRVSQVASDYPDAATRAAAVLCTQTLVSRNLKGASGLDKGKLIEALNRTARDDRLLPRDGRKFIELARLRSATRHLESRQGRRLVGPRVIRTISLPGREIRWLKAISTRQGIFAAGCIDGDLVLSRTSWSEAETSGKSWSVGRDFTSGEELILAVDPAESRRLLISEIPARRPFAFRDFQPTEICPFETSAGFDFSPLFDESQLEFQGPLAATMTPDSEAILSITNGQLILSIYGWKGQLLGKHSLQDLRPASQPLDVLCLPLRTHGNRFVGGVGSDLYSCTIQGGQKQTSLSGRVTDIAVSDSNTRFRVATATDSVNRIYWDDIETGPSEVFARGFESPQLCINLGGYLIAAVDGCCQIYSTQHRELRLEAEILGREVDPVAVLAGPHEDTFAVVTAEGQISIYQIP